MTPPSSQATTQHDDEAEVAIVTGVSPGGLGINIARALLEGGRRLMVADHPVKGDQLSRVVDDLSTSGTVLGEVADVSDEAQVDRLVARALTEFGRIDALVNSAGVMLRKDVFATTLSEWDTVIRTNLTGTWLTNRAVGRYLCEQRRGSIVNVSSVYADRVGPLPESAYYASKAAVANLTRSMAAEFGPYDVTVNCLAPGVFFPTDMTLPLQDDPDTLANMERRTMLGRLGDPQHDIHGVVAFLISDAARYVTGQTVFVDGGWSAW